MPLAGSFKQVLFADLLEFYCVSRQTAAVSVTAGEVGRTPATGTFFVEGGAVVDASFEGKEGAEAVRQAVQRLNDGAFEVELGARSNRRTVLEPWRVLLQESGPLRGQAPAGPPAPARPDAVEIGEAVRPPPRPGPASSPGVVSPPSPQLRSGLERISPHQTEPLPRIGRALLPKRFGTLLAFAGALLVGVVLALVVRELVDGISAVDPPRTEGAKGDPKVRRAPIGVTDTEVLFGMAAPLSGPSRELGRQMKLGLETAFAEANSEGGVHGRRVRLLAADDGYEPTRTRQVVEALAEEQGVFGFVGNVGTPTSLAALPYVLKRGMLFFGPSSGGPSLRKEPPDRRVFTFRASVREETAAIVRYLVEVRRLRPDQIGVLSEEDSYGDSGYDGVLRALQRYPNAGLPLRVTYARNTSNVSKAATQVLERRDRLRAIVMIATYRPAARFIERVWAVQRQMIFATVSQVGSQALADELLPLGPQFVGGVIVSQVVPLPTSHSTMALRYRKALGNSAPGEKPDFGSLEGYLAGNLLLEGLRRCGGTVNTDNMVRALETIQSLDLGLGTQVAFGPTDHQGLHKVWGTVLDASGRYQPLEFD